MTNGSPYHVTITIIDNDGKCLSITNYIMVNIKISLHFVMIDITMNLGRFLYFGLEMDGSVQIDVVISNPSSVDITLQVRSEDSSASSEGILCLHMDINHIQLF